MGCGTAKLIKPNNDDTKHQISSISPIKERITKNFDPNNHHLLGIYFSASWCHPCKKFTIQLKHFYNTINNPHEPKRIEIILFPQDKTKNEFMNYIKNMPWLTLDINDPYIKQFAEENKLTGLPKLYILKDGEIITANARPQVAKCMNHLEMVHLIDAWEEGMDGYGNY